MRLTAAEFARLMQEVAAGWSAQDTERALACFAPDVVYIEPPDVQCFQGLDQLRPYFAALRPGTLMRWHHLWFDEAAQTGAGEYSFGSAGRPTADHGVAVVEIRDGRIAFWREYQRKGPAAHADFIAIDGKSWQWHAGNYP